MAASVRLGPSRPAGLRRGRHANLRAAGLELVHGAGLEIGPLHNPFPVPPGSSVTYADQCGREELTRRNPDVPEDRIIEPEIICDCHTFDEVADGSFDFIIASHVIEHLDNPVRALHEWRRILRPGGRVLCVVPDGRFTFDAGRPFTAVEHLVWDYEHDGTDLKQLSDLFHIAECNLNMHEGLTPASAVDLALEILATSNDTHFHVWSAETFGSHMEALRRRWQLPFRVVAHGSDDAFELVCVLEATRAQRPAARAGAAA